MRMRKNRFFALLMACVVAAAMMPIGIVSVFAAEKQAEEGVVASCDRALLSNQPKVADMMKLDGNSGESAVVPAGGTGFLEEGVSNGMTIDHGSTYKSQDTWLMIKPSRTGMISISQGAGGYIRLYDSKKKPLSDEIYVRADASVDYMTYASFGVKANTLYYVCVKSGGVYSSATKTYFNVVKYESTAVRGSFGKSAAKASKMKRNTDRYGYLLAKGSPKYYKFTKTGKSVKIYFKGVTDKQLKFTVTAKAKGYRNYSRTISLFRSDNGDDEAKVLTLSTKKNRAIHVTIRAKGEGNSSGAYVVRYH